jgi:hypothetical protein
MMKAGNLKYMKRVYNLDRDCVWVHLTSIDGADFIRIHSCAEGGGCRLKMSAVAIGGNKAEFTFKLTTDEEADFYRISIDVGGPHLASDSTDGVQYGSTGSKTAEQIKLPITNVLEFVEPGTYTVSAYAYSLGAFVSDSVSWPIDGDTGGGTGPQSYQMVMNMGSITEATQTVGIVTALGTQPYDVFIYVNGELHTTASNRIGFNAGTFLVKKVPIIDGIVTYDFVITEPIFNPIARAETLRSITVANTETGSCFPSASTTITVI